MPELPITLGPWFPLDRPAIDAYREKCAEVERLREALRNAVCAAHEAEMELRAEVERLRRMELHYEQHAVNDYDDWIREEADRG